MVLTEKKMRKGLCRFSCIFHVPLKPTGSQDIERALVLESGDVNLNAFHLCVSLSNLSTLSLSLYGSFEAFNATDHFPLLDLLPSSSLCEDTLYPSASPMFYLSFVVPWAGALSSDQHLAVGTPQGSLPSCLCPLLPTQLVPFGWPI